MVVDRILWGLYGVLGEPRWYISPLAVLCYLVDLVGKTFESFVNMLVIVSELVYPVVDFLVLDPLLKLFLLIVPNVF